MTALRQTYTTKILQWQVHKLADSHIHSYMHAHPN